VPAIPVDEDEWTLAITGVDDAGYAAVPQHKVKLERGKLTTLHYELKRKS